MADNGHGEIVCLEKDTRHGQRHEKNWWSMWLLKQQTPRVPALCWC